MVGGTEGEREATKPDIRLKMHPPRDLIPSVTPSTGDFKLPGEARDRGGNRDWEGASWSEDRLRTKKREPNTTL